MNTFLFKKYATFAAIAVTCSTMADTPLGLIGGGAINAPNSAYAAIFSTSGGVTPFPGLPTPGTIRSVDINAHGQGIIGGQSLAGTQPAYAAIVSASGSITSLSGLPANGSINDVAINALGKALIGGQDNAGPSFPPFAVFVSSTGVVTPITGLPSPSRVIATVDINDAGQGILGGRNFSGATSFGFIVSPSGTATSITGLPTTIELASSAINNSGQGIIGGVNFATFTAYAAIVSPAGVATPIPSLPSPMGSIGPVAINDSGIGLIGGQNITTGAAYAAFVSPAGIPTPISLGLGATGNIGAVAINSSGQGILGGQNQVGPGTIYAALVSSSGVVTIISNDTVLGAIESVSINDFGQGVIGGSTFNGQNVPYAAIISPSGIATTINLGLNDGDINAVAILPVLSQIPTSGFGTVTGNNLAFANYINQFAPQNAFYFVPSVFDGTLPQALASAAPTRNAFSLYTASNNLFYWGTSLSNHLRTRFVRDKKVSHTALATAVSEDWKSSDELLADASESWKSPDQLQASIMRKKIPERKLPYCEEVLEEKTNSLWIQGIGALAHQKAQSQTPAFDPASGGVIVGYDGKTSEHTRLGIGAAYLFTHIHEKQHAGHSNIQQEDLFVYGTWENKNFYLDAAVLGGPFQTDQVRNIRMTGFQFKSKSHPHGWQLLPHVELGYHFTRHRRIDFTINPFVMVDWANNWQHHYKEKGSGPFNAGQKSLYSWLLRTEASLRLYETIFFDKWDLTFLEKGGYVHVQTHNTGKVNAFLVGSPGSFTVSTLTKNQDLAVAEFGMIFSPHRPIYPSCLIFYQGEFSHQYKSHQVGLELSWDF